MTLRAGCFCKYFASQILLPEPTRFKATSNSYAKSDCMDCARLLFYKTSSGRRAWDVNWILCPIMIDIGII